MQCHLPFFCKDKLSVSCFVDIAVLVHILEASALYVDAGSCDIEGVIITKMMPRTNPVNRELATTVSVRKEEDGQHQQNFHRIQLHHYFLSPIITITVRSLHCSLVGIGKPLINQVKHQIASEDLEKLQILTIISILGSFYLNCL